jgi:hypothetical protein
VKIELTPDAAQWVEAVLAAGRFLTAEDAIRHAVNQVKIAELRAALDASEAEGGRLTTGRGSPVCTRSPRSPQADSGALSATAHKAGIQPD